MIDANTYIRYTHEEALAHEYLEPFECYSAGGYYPAKINEILSSPSAQYRLVHRLGHGASSTLWLALIENKSQWVAIKIAISSIECLNDSPILKNPVREGTKHQTLERSNRP